jgi:hypothetical protein
VSGETYLTESGRFVVYHKSDAGAPELHDSDEGDWYFEPKGYSDGEVFSGGYPTWEDALAAAENWESDALAFEERLQREAQEAYDQLQVRTRQENWERFKRSGG